MATEKTTAEEVKEAEALAAAELLAAALGSTSAGVDNAVRYGMDAPDGLEDGALVDAIALVQDLRRRLGDVERDLTVAAGHRLGKTGGSLSDGRQWTLSRSADRKEWDHEDWKRDVRRKLVQHTTDEMGATVNIVTKDGEVQELNLAALLHSAITDAQEVHGSTAPRSTSLKRLGLYASDYCTSTPSGWRFNALAPSTPTTTEEDTTHG